MGSLAMWGAVGGAGRAGESYIKDQADRDWKTSQADIDFEREKVLARIRGEEQRKGIQTSGDVQAETVIPAATEGRIAETEAAGDVQAETVIPARTEGLKEVATHQGGIESGLIGERGEQARETVRVTESSRSGRESDQRVWKSRESVLDRENALEIAKLRTQATSAGSSEVVKRHMGRYKAQKLNEAIVMENGFPVGAKEQPAVYDELSGSWYISRGEKLTYPSDAGKDPKEVAQPADGKYREHNPGDLTMLYDAISEGGIPEEQAKAAFYQKFGYLPKGMLQQIMIRDINSDMTVIQRAQSATATGNE